MNAQSLGKLPLRDAARDSERHEGPTQSVEIEERVDISAPKPLVVVDSFLELGLK